MCPGLPCTAVNVVLVVIQRYGIALQGLRAAQGLGLPVVAPLGRREDHAAIEDREDLAEACRRRCIPELEVAAVFLAPLGRQIENQVDSPQQLVAGVMALVDVDAEFARGVGLVNAAADEPRIGNQAVYSGQRLDELDHRVRV